MDISQEVTLSGRPLREALDEYAGLLVESWSRHETNAKAWTDISDTQIFETREDRQKAYDAFADDPPVKRNPRFFDVNSELDDWALAKVDLDH